MIQRPLLTLVVFSGLCCTALFGQQNQNRSNENQSDRQGRQQAQSELPKSLQGLDLTDSQKKSIKQAINQHDKKFTKTWRDFNAAHARTIELEAAWLAAVRDTLSTEDQENFDQQRQASRDSKSKAADANRSNRDRLENRRRNRNGDASDRRDRSNDSSGQQDRKNRRSNTEQNGSDRDRSSAGDEGNANSSQDSADNAISQSGDSPGQSADSEGFLIVTVSSPVVFTRGARQSMAQKQQCSEACRQYERALSLAWHEVKQLHEELVQIEADRMSTIEQQLNEDQLKKLRERRQQPSDSESRRIARTAD